MAWQAWSDALVGLKGAGGKAHQTAGGIFGQDGTTMIDIIFVFN